MSESLLHNDVITRPEWTVYPQSSYSFQSSDSITAGCLSLELDAPTIERREATFNRNGMRTTVFAAILCHWDMFPCFILLKRKSDGTYGFIGGKAKSYSDPSEALLDKLARFVQFKSARLNQLDLQKARESINVGELLSENWRAGIDSFVLPYLPLHVNRPRERLLLYQVTVSPNCALVAPSGYAFEAVPLHKLLSSEYGHLVSALPHLISRFKLVIMC